MGLKVSRGFKSYTDAKSVSFANTVYERMSSDNQYITLKPFVDNIKIKKDALVTVLLLYGKTKTAEMRKMLLKKHSSIF